MNTERYKQQLLELEQELTTRTRRETSAGRDQRTDDVGDLGDASVAEEAASAAFTAAELDSGRLQEVRDALRRIEDGRFGKCLVDGEPIETKRLDAAPWSAYCLKHQAERDAGTVNPPPTM